MSRCVSDGVVLIDPEYLKERKGETREQNQNQNQNQTCFPCLVSLLSLQSSSR